MEIADDACGRLDLDQVGLTPQHVARALDQPERFADLEPLLRAKELREPCGSRVVGRHGGRGRRVDVRMPHRRASPRARRQPAGRTARPREDAVDHERTAFHDNARLARAVHLLLER